MTAIFRYELDITPTQDVKLPSGHQVLSIAPGRAGYYIDVWVKIGPGDHDTLRTFRVFGTGHPLPDPEPPMDFLGTAVMSDGLVWHVFTEIPQ